MTPTLLESEHGHLRLEPLTSDQVKIVAEPSTPGFFVSRKIFVSKYPQSLIEHILSIKGLAYVCDEIARDEDPRYVRFDLETGILTYVDRDALRGKCILDFGCGSGASTMSLHRMFPDAHIIGVELDPKLLSIARARARHYGFPEDRLLLSPSGTELPPELPEFDFIVMHAVFEHLLPAERKTVLRLLWKKMKKGGVLLLDATPYRFTPVETHTTGLPLINYLPAKITRWAACRFSPRLARDESWETLLRKGIRGGTESEVLRLLRTVADGRPSLLSPSASGIKDRVDLWAYRSEQLRLRALKRAMYYGYKLIKAVTGLTLVPTLTMAIRKD